MNSMMFTLGVASVLLKVLLKLMYKLIGGSGPRSVRLGNGPLDQYLQVFNNSRSSFSQPQFNLYYSAPVYPSLVS